MTDALKIARLVASADNADSADDSDAPVNAAHGQSLKKRGTRRLPDWGKGFGGGGGGRHEILSAAPGPWVFAISDDI